jgi:probable addiction module antidote protein
MLETRPYDSARYLDNNETIAGYLEAAFEEAFETDDPSFIVHAFGVVARARGMTQIAKDAGLSRESLYRALGENGNPEFSTVLKVAKALGLRLAVVAG